MRQDTERDARALRDPALTAILKTTFADDPALAESPGRTERIMRLVLAAGAPPVRRRVNWAPLGWICAAAGAATLVMALAIGLVRLPAGWGPEMQNTVATAEHATATTPTAPLAPSTASPDVSGVNIAANPSPAVLVPKQEIAAPSADWQPLNGATAPEHNPAQEQEQEQLEMADSLYDAGATAHAAGDLQTAYDAYQASYDANPTVHALMAASETLGNLADDELADDAG